MGLWPPPDRFRRILLAVSSLEHGPRPAYSTGRGQPPAEASPRTPHNLDLEEWLNAGTHGVAAAASLVGTAILVALSLADPARAVASAVFGVSLTGLYLASTLYHGTPTGRWKARLRTIDHCAIFLLIAGTYTPFMVLTLGGWAGASILGFLWALAGIGIGLELAYGARLARIQLAIYLSMGWMIVVVGPTMIERLGTGALSLLVAGGLAYTLGVGFYLARRMPFGHTVWHLFTIGGSACHFFAVARVVL